VPGTADGDGAARFVMDVELTDEPAKRLREIFEAHAKDGRVSFDYDTRVYAGPL